MMSNQQPSQTTVRDRHLISSRFTIAIWAMWAGRLLSARWRPIAVAAVLVIALLEPFWSAGCRVT